VIVLKFGGTSVGGAEPIRRVGNIVKGCMGRRPLVLVSAVGGVTDRLFMLRSIALDGGDWEGHLDALRATHD